MSAATALPPLAPPPAAAALPASDATTRDERASKMERCIDDIDETRMWRNRLAVAWIMAVIVGLLMLGHDGIDNLVPDLLTFVAGLVLLVTTIVTPLLMLQLLWLRRRWSKLRQAAQAAGEL